MSAHYLQAQPRLLNYAGGMSSADEAIALFTDHDTGATVDDSVVPCPATRGTRAHSEDTWEVRRAIVRARSALIGMRLDDASRATAQLKRLLSNCADARRARYVSALPILEGAILAAGDNCSAARAKLLPVASRTRDPLAATLLRYLDWKHAARAELHAPDTVDYLATPVGGHAASRILSLCVSAAFAFDRLELAVSANLAAQALDLARLRYGVQSSPSTLPATLLAQVAYEQGRLEEAEALLRPRLAVIRACGMLECVARASVLLARISLHRGRHLAALATLRQTEALGRARRWPRLVCIAASEYARTLETLRHDEGQTSASRTPKGDVIPLEKSRCASNIAKGLQTAQLRMPCDPPELSNRAELDTLSPDETPSFSAVESALQRACVTASHRSNHNYELLIPWLRIGAARGLHMVFVDAGRSLSALLEGLYYAMPTHDPRLSDLRPYIATLLRSTARPTTEESSSITYRPLSRRETGILQMIAHGMSNKRIAQSLGITPETVKSHAKSIFVKLATRTRAQAVARAEAIGFL